MMDWGWGAGGQMPVEGGSGGGMEGPRADGGYMERQSTGPKSPRILEL